MRRTVTINFPAPLPAEIPCPICEGNKCRICDRTGKMHITVDAKIPIQRGLIVKYVAENMADISTELSKHYGLVPDVETTEMIEINSGQYEIVKISSLGGVIWVANRVDKLESPRYFNTLKDLKTFRSGWHDNE
tara:strand:+ start:779 stop:1180 length:402 start_codon:yes stop_codon:yes gene_type:complete